MRRHLFALFVLGLCGCNTGVKAAPEPGPSPSPPAPAASPAPASDSAKTSSLRLGAPIEGAGNEVSLAEVAKAPGQFKDKTFKTKGTVSAVCQHMGCWMELKDDAGQAHIKMAGHSFFVPKTASGKKARVEARLVPTQAEPEACGDGMHKDHKGGGCKAEAEKALGRPLAKLELIATGVELYD
jgi:Rieske Fe-S protein